MPDTPYLTIDLDKIEHNARTLVALCAAHGITVTGVTKCVCGHPEVARAMLRGGVASIADSRLANIRRLKAAGIHQAGMLLRLPALSVADAVVETVELSLNSEPAVLARLSAAAERRGIVHGVILMVDLGDLREGAWPTEFTTLVQTARNLSGILLRGIGTNLACFGGVVPTATNMNQLVEFAVAAERINGRPLEWISGANSSALELIASGRMPARINHARLGEAILLGRETVQRKAWPGTHQDAFVLHAEVLELNTKPSMPIGERGEDAFGHRPSFRDRGPMRRVLLNVGREDVMVEGVTPLEPGVEILGASSGYLVLDVSRAKRDLSVGDELRFALDYGALLAAMTSEYVAKHLVGGGSRAVADRR